MFKVYLLNTIDTWILLFYPLQHSAIELKCLDNLHLRWVLIWVVEGGVLEAKWRNHIKEEGEILHVKC